MVSARTLRKETYAATFFTSAQFGLSLFFNAAYLATLGFSEGALGIIFSFAYVGALGLVLLMPMLLRRFGNYRTFIASAIVTGLLSALLALSPSPTTAALLVMSVVAVNILLYTLLDIFLEVASDDRKSEGAQRGLFDTVRHGGMLVAQLAAGTLLLWGGFAYLYGAVAGMLALIALGVAFFFKNFPEPQYERLDWVGVLFRLYQSPNMRRVLKLQFLLYLFYGIMVVFTPVYLIEYAGMTPREMGIVFAIMLAPFLLLEVALGKLEDARGEKSVLVGGLLVLALSTAALAFITSSSVAVWAAALFATRVGAVMLQMGNEVYFFKHVDASNDSEIATFRAIYPLAFAVGPFIGAILLVFMPLSVVFVLLGLLMLLGIPSARALTEDAPTESAPETPAV